MYWYRDRLWYKCKISNNRFKWKGLESYYGMQNNHLPTLIAVLWRNSFSVGTYKTTTTCKLFFKTAFTLFSSLPTLYFTTHPKKKNNSDWKASVVKPPDKGSLQYSTLACLHVTFHSSKSNAAQFWEWEWDEQVMGMLRIVQKEPTSSRKDYLWKEKENKTFELQSQRRKTWKVMS